MSEKDKLIRLINESEDINRYRRLEKIINDDPNLKQKFAQLKALQKQLVNAKHIGKTEAIAHLQTTYDTLYQSIEDMPLMSDYMALQSDINDMVQYIVKIVEEGLEEEFTK